MRQHLEGDDARQREHHRQLPADADQQDERGRFVRHRPERIAPDVADDRVADLVQPVHAVQRETGADDVPVFVVDLRPVDVEHDGQNENERPVEVFRASDADGVDQIPGGLRSVAPEYEHAAPSFVMIRFDFRQCAAKRCPAGDYTITGKG